MAEINSVPFHWVDPPDKDREKNWILLVDWVRDAVAGMKTAD